MKLVTADVGINENYKAPEHKSKVMNFGNFPKETLHGIHVAL